MAITSIAYSVSKSGISPATKQKGGTQGDHNVASLDYTISADLYSSLTALTDVTLKYRFDVYFQDGAKIEGTSANLSSSTVSLSLDNAFTKHGGTITVYLIITAAGTDSTEMELYSFPALIEFKGLPDGDPIDKEEFESLTTLAESAKSAAESASASKSAAELAEGRTELAKAALEDGSTFIFDGGDSEGYVAPDIVVDSELSSSSDNAISNKAVAIRFNGIDAAIDELDETKASAQSLSELAEDLETKTEMRRIDSGTSGIWTWEKWSDGTAKIWGEVTISEISGFTAWVIGSVYYKNLFADFPADLFVEPPFNYNVISNSNSGVMPIAGKQISATQVGFTVIRFDTNTISNAKFLISAVGRWEEAEI